MPSTRSTHFCVLRGSRPKQSDRCASVTYATRSARPGASVGCLWSCRLARRARLRIGLRDRSRVSRGEPRGQKRTSRPRTMTPRQHRLAPAVDDVPGAVQRAKVRTLHRTRTGLRAPVAARGTPAESPLPRSRRGAACVETLWRVALEPLSAAGDVSRSSRPCTLRQRRGTRPTRVRTKRSPGIQAESRPRAGTS